jgi:acyl-coenzyme A thioesterase 9
VTTVTASCDRITIHSPLTEICDLELSGRVTYATGRSSLEITMQVAKAPKQGEEAKDEDVLINCTFTMVSRSRHQEVKLIVVGKQTGS